MDQFNYFPKINYPTKEGFTKETVDITKRIDFFKSVKSNSVLFQKYTVQDGERPDVVSHKFYQRADYDWIILYVNNVHNIRKDWPLGYLDFNDYIEEKYGSIENAHQSIRNYKWVISPRQRLSTGEYTEEVSINVQLEQYSQLIESERRIETWFDYEEEENLRKSRIKILDKSFIPYITAELKDVF